MGHGLLSGGDFVVGDGQSRTSAVSAGAPARASGSLRVLLANDKLGVENTRLHGAGRLVIDWTRALLEGGVDVTPVILRAAGPLGDQVRAAGLPFVFLNRPRYHPGTLHDLVALIRRHRIQLVHLQGFGSSLFGRMAAQLTGIPAIVHVHADHRSETGGYPAFVRRLDRLLATRTAHVLAVSESVAEFAIEEQGFRPEQITVCRNSIDRQRFRPATAVERAVARTTFGLPANAPVVACVARLNEVKGVDILVAAWTYVAAALPDAVLLLVGDGPQRGALQQQVAGTSWERNVRFAGYRSDVETALWAADLVVVPSRGEGLSLAALEAMGVGLPVVASRVGGIPEVVQDGTTGILVPPEAPEELARAVVSLLTDAERRARFAMAASRASVDYDLTAFAEQLAGIYASVLARAQR